MRRSVAFVAGSLLAVGTVLAQDGTPREPRGDGPFRGPPGGMMFGGGPARGMMMGGPMGGRMFGRVSQELELDETQSARFDELMAPTRARMDEMRQKFIAAREAADNGDPTLMNELRAQGAADRGEGMRAMAEAMNNALEELEPTLRADQIEKLDTMRDRMERDQESMERVRRVGTELPDALKLDDAQREKFEELRREAREAIGEQWSAMRPLFEQMRAAEESGDTELLKQLRAQFEAQRPNPDAQFENFFGKVEGMLREEQLGLLDEFKADLGMNAPGAANASGTSDVKAVLKIAKRLRLNASQKDTFKEIESDSLRSLREVRRDEEARTMLAARVKERIEQILEPAQLERFHTQLERLDRRANGR